MYKIFKASNCLQKLTDIWAINAKLIIVQHLNIKPTVPPPSFPQPKIMVYNRSFDCEVHSYLEVINTFEVLHSSPHDPDFVGNHIPLFIKNIDNYRFFHKPERILQHQGCQLQL